MSGRHQRRPCLREHLPRFPPGALSFGETVPRPPSAPSHERRPLSARAPLLRPRDEGDLGRARGWPCRPLGQSPREEQRGQRGQQVRGLEHGAATPGRVKTELRNPEAKGERAEPQGTRLKPRCPIPSRDRRRRRTPTREHLGRSFGRRRIGAKCAHHTWKRVTGPGPGLGGRPRLQGQGGGSRGVLANGQGDPLWFHKKSPLRTVPTSQWLRLGLDFEKVVAQESAEAPS